MTTDEFKAKVKMLKRLSATEATAASAKSFEYASEAVEMTEAEVVAAFDAVLAERDEARAAAAEEAHKLRVERLRIDNVPVLRERTVIAVTGLIDEAERVALAEADEGSALPHLTNAIDKVKSCLAKENT